MKMNWVLLVQATTFRGMISKLRFTNTYEPTDLTRGMADSTL
jgi:hypothetical protein